MTERLTVETIISEDGNGDYKFAREELRKHTLQILVPTLVDAFVNELHSVYVQNPQGKFDFTLRFDAWLSESDVTNVLDDDRIKFYEREFDVLTRILDPWSKHSSAIGRTAIERVIGNSIRTKLGLGLTLEHTLEASVTFGSDHMLPVFGSRST
jgi:hypothetical protein